METTTKQLPECPYGAGRCGKTDSEICHEDPDCPWAMQQAGDEAPIIKELREALADSTGDTVTVPRTTVEETIAWLSALLTALESVSDVSLEVVRAQDQVIATLAGRRGR